MLSSIWPTGTWKGNYKIYTEFESFVRPNLVFVWAEIEHRLLLRWDEEHVLVWRLNGWNWQNAAKLPALIMMIETYTLKTYTFHIYSYDDYTSIITQVSTENVLHIVQLATAIYRIPQIPSPSATILYVFSSNYSCICSSDITNHNHMLNQQVWIEVCRI